MAQRVITYVTRLLVAAVLMGCGAAATPTASPVPSNTPAWPKPIVDTVCTDWTAAMTTDQRSVMAAAMLNALRRTDKPEARLAADALVQAFVADVTAACADDPGLPDEKKIVSIPATLVYLESGPKYRP